MSRFTSFLFSILICMYSVWINQFDCHSWRPLRFCKVISSIRDKSLCDELSSEADISCSYAIDRSHCIKQLLGDEADFAVLKVEDLLLASYLDNSSNYNVVITNEFRLSQDEKHEFDMVALVSNQIIIESLADLRDKRLCHPGFDENGGMYDFSKIFLQYFEEIVVPEECNQNLSVLENKIHSLNSFFLNSCKPGPWSSEPSLDRKLKSRYINLCASCQDSYSCSHRDLYWGPQGAVTCLFDCAGDVAWVRHQDINVQLRPAQAIGLGIFQRIKNGSMTIVNNKTIGMEKTRSSQQCQDVSYLCPDGTKQPITTTNPCLWISRPWPVLVSRKQFQEDVSSLISYINNSSNTYTIGTWEYAMRFLLNDKSFQSIDSIQHISLTNYLDAVPGFLNASTVQKCKGTGQDKVIKVCIENKESQEKCDLLSVIARIYSLDPEIECQIEINCVKSVAENKQDVYITSVENLRNARKIGSLKSILYQTAEDYADLRYSSVVVPANSSIQSIKDLKGKKACFTKFDGLGWNSLLMILHEHSLVDDICDGTKVMKNFFADLCIIDHRETDEIRSCFDEFDDLDEKVDGILDVDEAQGLRCLIDGGGDVTLIDHNFIEQYIAENKYEAWAEGLNESSFRTICPYLNSSDHECYLFRAAFGEVLTRKDIPLDREEEIISVFLDLNSLFGEKQIISRPTNSKIFRLFSHHHDEKNVLFESSASRLESSKQYFNRARLVKNVFEREINEIVDICSYHGTTTKYTSSALLISNPVILYLLPLFTISYFV